MPTLKQLHYFTAVARTKSFSRAATEVHVAQPALSTHIANLEAELDNQLLTRHSRGVELTEAGKFLATRAEEILAMVETMTADIRALKGDVRGQVRIGLPTTTTTTMALPLLDVFGRQLPGVTLSIVEGMTGHLQDWLDHGDLDLAILFDAESSSRHNRHVLGREGLSLIGPCSGLNMGRTSFSLEESLQLPMVHCTRAHHLRRYLETMAHAFNAPLNIVAEIDSLAQIKTIVFQGAGYTILPRSAVSPDWVHGATGAWDIDDVALDIVLMVSSTFAQGGIHDVVIHTLIELTKSLMTEGAWPGGESCTPKALPII